MNEKQAGRTQTVTAEVALRAVVEQVSRASGGELYRRLAAALGRVFGACYAGIGEIAADGTRVAMLGSWARQDAASPGEFTLAGTPAAEVALGRTAFHPEHVRRDFPADQRLQRLYADSYLGVPITDARGDVLGLIELVSDGPLSDPGVATAILMAMAERAVIEMERDQAEAALRDSEMRYRALIEDSFHLVAEVVGERYVYVSSGYTDALGYAPEDLLGGSIFDLIHVDERKPVAGELQATLAHRRAVRFTVRMRHREGSWRWIECTARAFRASSGEFRTTMFSRDITDRLHAEETLRESEELFRTLIKDLRVGVVLHDADARVLVCNDAALTLLGLTEEQILGRTSYDDEWNPMREDGSVIPPQERPVPLAIATGKPVRDVVYGVRRASREDMAWVLASAEPQFDSNGAVDRVICSIIDITARLAAERELRESESRFRFLAENSTDVIARYDKDGVCIWMSPSVKAAAGYDPEELIGQSVNELFQDNTSLLDYALSEVEAGRESFRATFPLWHRDGHTVWMEAMNHVIRDADTGEIIEIHTSSRDITARKEAEDELRESEARFRLLAENSTDIIGRYTPEGVCIWISPSIKAVTGLYPEAAIGQVPGDHIHPDDREGRLDVVRALVAGQDQATQTFRFRHVDGYYIWLEAHVRAIRDADGNLIEIQTSSRDVTARKQAEDELRESEARFRLLAENATDMIARFATDGSCMWASPSSQAITGLTPEEVMEAAPDSRVHPEDAPAVWEAFKAMVEGEGARRATFRYRHKDGHYIWLEADARAIRDGSGRVVEIHSSTRDVTARMEADEELRESEARFRLIAENATDMIGRYTPDSVCLWVSPSVTSILGYEPTELIGTNARDGIHPEDLRRITDLPENWERPDTTTRTLRYRHKDGHYIWVESTTKAVRDPRSGEVIELHNTSRDVTARMIAQDALRESEERYRSLSESSPLGVYETSADGQARYFNGRAIRMMGLPLEEMTGWGWSRHVHADDRPIVEAAWRAATQDGRECTIEYRVQGPRGTIWVCSHAMPIRRADGTVEKYVGTVDDITKRREAEEALRRSEQLFRATLESTADGIVVMRPYGELLYWNNRAAEMLAIPREILESRDIREFGRYIVENAGEPEDLVRMFASLRNDEPTHTGTWTSRDGRLFEAFAHPLEDPSGDTLRVWSIREVTQQHQSEQALRQSEARFRSLAEHTTDLVLSITGPGIIDYVSPNARAILGYSPDDMLGWNAMDFVHEDDLPYVVEEFTRAAEEEGAASSVVRVRAGNGEWRWFEFTANFYTSNAGEQRAVVTARDITSRKLAEDALRESEERLRTVVNSVPLVLVAVDREETLVLAEGQGLAVLGTPARPLVGRSIAEELEHYPRVLADMRRALAGEQVSSTAVFGRVVFEAHFRPLFDDHGQPSGMIGVAYDITARVQAERLLRDSEETARALLNAPTDGAVLVDREGTILAMNETAENRFHDHAAKRGMDPRDFIGTCVFDIFPADLRAQRRARNDEVFQNGKRRHFEDERDGVWTDVTIDPILDADGKVMRLAIFSRDITDRKQDEAALRKRSRELEALNDYLEKTSAELERSQEELRDASEQLADLLEAEQVRSKTDTLTGALNHGAISEVIREAIACDVALAVAMVDVDGMKAVNDTYGHQAGDAVLREVTGAITRGGAIAGRYGGDEFLVALLNTDRAEAEAYKEAVASAIGAAQVIDPETGALLPVLASIGIALYPEDASTFKALVERADERMYEEKKGRKGNGNGLSSSRTLGDERASRMVGELVPLLTSSGTLDEKLRLVAHRLSVGAGYAGVNFDVLAEGGPSDKGGPVTVSQNAFTKAPEEVLEAWNRQQRAGTNTGVGELLRKTGKPVIIDDIADSRFVTEEQKRLLLSIGIQSGIVVPLFAGEAMVATMSVGSKERAGFGQADLQFLTEVGGHVAAIIRMARLVDELRHATDRLEEARDETVMLLAEAAEAHTQNDTRHFLNTRELAEAIAVEMGFEEERVRELGQAAALHDVGKIHLPDALLSSPELFSPLRGAEPGSEAWEALKQHCTSGRDFLARTHGFGLAATVAYSHHERWDGTGYPEGLSGDAIPIESSIVAVADSLDAMITESAYQPRRALDDAVAEVQTCSGTQFCPQVVEALVRLHARGALGQTLGQGEEDAAAA